MKTLIALIIFSQLFGCVMTPEQSALMAYSLSHHGHNMQHQNAPSFYETWANSQPKTYNVRLIQQSNPYGFYMAQ